MTANENGRDYESMEENDELGHERGGNTSHGKQSSKGSMSRHGSDQRPYRQGSRWDSKQEEQT